MKSHHEYSHASFLPSSSCLLPSECEIPLGMCSPYFFLLVGFFPFLFFIPSNKKDSPLLCHRRRCCVILKCDVSVQCTHHVNVRYVLSLPHPPTPPPILFGANVQSAELTRYKAQRSEGEGNERDIRFFSRCSFIHHCVMFI